jgi:hypothetical protein
MFRLSLSLMPTTCRPASSKLSWGCCYLRFIVQLQDFELEKYLKLHGAISALIHVVEKRIYAQDFWFSTFTRRQVSLSRVEYLELYSTREPAFSTTGESIPSKRVCLLSAAHVSPCASRSYPIRFLLKRRFLPRGG